MTGPESGQRSNKPIKTGDDYKGVKMRQCGRVQAKILQDLGGAAIFMPGSEIYLALSRGTIDAAEFSVPGVRLVHGVSGGDQVLGPAGLASAGSGLRGHDQQGRLGQGLRPGQVPGQGSRHGVHDVGLDVL